MRDAIKLVEFVLRIAFGVIGLMFRILGFLLALVLRRPGGLPKHFVSHVRIVDGDSLVATYKDREVRLRLHGIDAPEHGQQEGAESTRALRRIIGSDPVAIYGVDRDQYGRVVARVITPNGVDVAQRLVQQGRALSAYSGRYDRDERTAKREGRGFWADGGIVDPAAWRAARRN